MQNEIKHYLDQFERFHNGSAGQAVHALRKKALREFEQEGFPTTRQEEWRFTNVKPLAQTPFMVSGGAQLQQPEVETFLFPGWQKPLIVLVNGRFDRELSRNWQDIPGVDVIPLKQVLDEDKTLFNAYLTKIVQDHETVFSRLNSAFMHDGVCLHINDKVRVQEEIHIVHVMKGGEKPLAAYPRNLIIAGKGSEACLIETFHSSGAGVTFTDMVSEVFVGENARLKHYRIQNESPEAFHVSNTAVSQKENSNYKSVTFTFGGRLVRNNISTALNGQGIESTLNGLYMVRDKQLIDNHTFIDHARAHCDSHELYRGILRDSARAVFSGKILVRPDAQKTDAKQSNNCLLLSDEARVDTKPQLEIYADDVKCTHGATVGQLDEEAAFYLRARGIPRHKATGILTYAFAEEIIAAIEVAEVRDAVHALLADRLGHEIDFTEV